MLFLYVRTAVVCVLFTKIIPDPHNVIADNGPNPICLCCDNTDLQGIFKVLPKQAFSFVWCTNYLLRCNLLKTCQDI